MRRGNGGDRERSGDPHFSQRDERRQKAQRCDSLWFTPNMGGALRDWGGEERESEGERSWR